MMGHHSSTVVAMKGASEVNLKLMASPAVWDETVFSLITVSELKNLPPPMKVLTNVVGGVLGGRYGGDRLDSRMVRFGSLTLQA